jgi:hypothetical protein
MTRAAALLEFLDTVGWEKFPAPAGVGIGPESHQDYRRTGTVEAARLGVALVEGCLALHAAFDDALELRLANDLGRATIRDNLLDVTSGDEGRATTYPLASPAERERAGAALGALLAEIGPLDASLELAIRKGRVAERIRRGRGWEGTPIHVSYYLFARSLTTVIEGEGLRALDGAFFQGPASQTVVAVGDRDALYYRGDLLTIIGETRLAEAVVGTDILGSAPSAAVEKYRVAMRERLSVDFRLRLLTPLHLLCTNAGEEDPALSAVLQRSLFHLGVLYTANRSQQGRADERSGDTAPAYLSSYYERNRNARVALGPGDEVNLAPETLAELARWPYEGEGRSDDRLDVLQKTLAQALVGDAAENTRALLANLPALLAEAKTQYGIFIDDQLDDFYKQRQGIADYAAEVAKKVADSVEAVTKGLVDSALATVAAVGGAVLAAVANDKLRGSAFSAILWIYAAYVFAQALYRMLSAAHSAFLLHDEAQARLQGSAEQLGDRSVAPLRTMLQRRWKQLRRWSTVTAIAYVGIVMLIVLLGIFGPQTEALRSTAPTPPSQRPVATVTASPMPIPTVPGTP